MWLRMSSLLVFELVFLVDLLAALARGGRLLARERSRHRRFTRSIRVALHGARGDFLAGDGSRLADQTPRGAAHQVHMDVVVVIGVGARREHRGELLARARLDVAQKTLLLGQTMPAVLHRDMPPIGECKG